MKINPASTSCCGAGTTICHHGLHVEICRGVWISPAPTVLLLAGAAAVVITSETKIANDWSVERHRMSIHDFPPLRLPLARHGPALMSITLYWKPIRGTRTETLQPLRNPEAMEKKLSINRSFTPETNQTNIYIYIFPEADQYLPFFLKEMKSFDLP